MSDHNAFKFYTIHLLANLIRIDQEGKFEKIMNDFYCILNGGRLVPACHGA